MEKIIRLKEILPEKRSVMKLKIIDKRTNERFFYKSSWEVIDLKELSCGDTFMLCNENLEPVLFDDGDREKVFVSYDLIFGIKCKGDNYAGKYKF